MATPTDKREIDLFDSEEAADRFVARTERGGSQEALAHADGHFDSHYDGHFDAHGDA